MTELTTNAKVIKFIEETKGEKFHNLFLGKNLLDRTQKGKKMTNYISSTINSLLFQKYC